MATKTNLTSYQIDKLNLLCRVIRSDKKLKSWFESFKVLPSNLRMNSIMQLTTEMRKHQEDNDIIGAVCTLSDKDVFAAAVDVIKS
jgi:hypothetical protein